MALPFTLDPFTALNQACVTTFPTTGAFYPQGGGGPLPITGARRDPPMIDAYSLESTTGVAVVHFFVDLNNTSPIPAKGDKITFGSQQYDVFDVGVDVTDGSFLKLRKRRP